MKKFYLFFAACAVFSLLSFTSCSGDKSCCWEITTRSLGETEVEYFWGTKAEVKVVVDVAKELLKLLDEDSKITYKKSGRTKLGCEESSLDDINEFLEDDINEFLE